MTTEQMDLPSLVLDSPEPVELEGLRRDLRFVSEGIAKELHIRVTWLRRNGFCPCCQREWVCREGEKLQGAEFDHFFARHRNGPEESWLVCGPCNARLENVHFKTHVRATFDAYQQALRVFLGAEQRELFQ